jgi:hypothetical protein
MSWLRFQMSNSDIPQVTSRSQSSPAAKSSLPPPKKKDEMNWSQKIAFIRSRDPALLLKPYAAWDLDQTIERLLKQ